MSNPTLPNYAALEAELKSQNLAVSPAELHGLLSGMICGGLAIDDEKNWLGSISDFANQGEALSDAAKAVVRKVFTPTAEEYTKLAQTLFSSTAAELADASFDVSVLLPTDADLLDQGEALSEWVTNFISGLGLMGVEKNKLSPEVTEAVGVMEEIAQLGIDDEGDMEEQAQLFADVVAYLPECVLTCLVELSQRPAEMAEPTIPGMDNPKPTLH